MGQIKSEQHNGRSTFLIVPEERVITKLPKQFNAWNDGFTYLEQILDIGDGIIQDCFSYFTATNDDWKPRGTRAQIKAPIIVTHEGREKEIDIFDNSSFGPSLVGKHHVFGINTFAIEVADGIMTQKACPIRKHKLLAVLGFEEKQVAQLPRDETETFHRLTERAPVQTWEPLFAALYSAEIEKATEETEELYEQEMTSNEEHEYHCTDCKLLYAHIETEDMHSEKNIQYGNGTIVFNLTQKVINRWTPALPLPTTDTWINATDQDPDLRLLKGR